MRDLTLKAKVPTKRFEGTIEGIDGRDDWYIDAVEKFYDRLMVNEFKAAFDAFEPMHLKPGMWTMYQLMGERHLPEQKTLNKAFAELQRAWKRHRPLKRRPKDVKAEATV